MVKRERGSFGPLLGLLPLWAASTAVLGAAFLGGGLLGLLAAGQVDGPSGAALEAYLRAWLQQGASAQAGLWPSLWGTIRFPLAVWLLGFTGAGAVLIPLVLGVRGFLLAFGSACFCRLLGLGGVLPALTLFGLPALLWAPVLFVLGVTGMEGAVCLLRRTALPLPWGRWVLCALALWGCVLLELLVLPGLMGLLSRIVLLI